MTTDDIKRKLTAILSADVKDYTRLMSQDEVGTIKTLNTHREMTANFIKQYKGRVIDTPGDNILAAFESVSNAVNCAVEIQRELAERNAEVPSARMMQWRIGINLGDVVEEEGRIYGDGVNIAARVENLCEPGGICISGTVYDQVKGRLGLEYEDLGEHSVKNITEPVRVYKIPLESRSEIEADKVKTIADRKWRNIALGVIAIFIVVGLAFLWHLYFRPTAPSEIAKPEKAAAPTEKPSIAVLPFENMSGDPDQEYFSDGMTEEIISRLSKNSMLTVIARNSTFTYKGKPIKVQQVAQDLGVQHVLEGSVRRSGNRVRITAQLVDAINGGHLWSETYEKEMKDIFAVQAEIAQRIAAALRVQYTEAELARVKHIPTDNLTAYDSFWRGYDHFYRMTRDDNALAQKYFKKAIELNPYYADAYAMLAFTLWKDYQLRWNTDPQLLDQAFDLTKKALSLDNSSVYAHAIQSRIYWMRNQNEMALRKAEKVISLDPNNADGYDIKSIALRRLGRLEEALESKIKAINLSPKEEAYANNLGVIYIHMGLYKKSIEAFKKAIANRPDNIIPYGNLARSYLFSWGTQQNENQQVLDLALEIAEKIVVLDGTKSIEGLWTLNDTYLAKRQHDLAIAESEKMIAHDPKFPSGYFCMGKIYNFMGRAEESIEILEKAIHLNMQQYGFPDAMLLYALGNAYRLSDRQDEALTTYKDVFDHIPWHHEAFCAHLDMAIIYSELGREEEARAEAAEVLKLVPNFSVQVYGERIPYKDPAQAERDMAALRKAGLK